MGRRFFGEQRPLSYLISAPTFSYFIETYSPAPRNDERPSEVLVSMSSPLPKWSSEDDRPLPEPTYIRKVLGDIWDGSLVLLMWTLLLWVPGFLFFFAVITGLPVALLVAVLGIAPVLTGMMVMVGRGAKGYFMRLGDAWRGMLRLYWRSVALTLPLALLLWLILSSADIASKNPGQSVLTISVALQIGIGLTLVVLHLYLLPLLALLDTPLKQTGILAVLLAGKFIWQTLALLAVSLALLALTNLHPLVWLVVPGVWCVIVVNAAWRMARQAVPDLAGIDK